MATAHILLWYISDRISIANWLFLQLLDVHISPQTSSKPNRTLHSMLPSLLSSSSFKVVRCAPMLK